MYQRQNEEVQELKKKMILCGVVFVFVMVLGLLLVFNRFGNDVDEVLQALYQKESFVVFFQNDSDKCPNCSMVEDTLNELGVSYYRFDVKVSSYDEVLQKLKIDYDITLPAVYVIEDGEVRYNLTNINDKDSLVSFVRNNDVAEFSNQNE